MIANATSIESSNTIELSMVQRKQIGITFSFTITHGPRTADEYHAVKTIEELNLAIKELVRTGFPSLTHTLTSRQEYLP